MSPRVYILAGTERQAKYYASKNGIAFYTLVYDPNQLRGLRNEKLIVFGMWYTKKLAPEILQIAKERDFDIVWEDNK